MNKKNSSILPHNYKDEKQMIEDFLRNYKNDLYDVAYPEHGQKKYISEIQKAVDKKTKVLEVLYEDIEDYFINKGEKFR